jgi:hypothetical protein
LRVRSKHYWRRRVRSARLDRLAAAACDAAGTIARLSTEPQPGLSWLERFLAFFTTPFKFRGISGWEETGCEAQAAGRPVRDAQHSTDGFWTIDVRLEAFAIGTSSADSGTDRFIRVEVEPETKAHDVCAGTRVGARMRIAFGGAVVVDTDGPFLEVHPEEEFRIVDEE